MTGVSGNNNIGVNGGGNVAPLRNNNNQPVAGGNGTNLSASSSLGSDRYVGSSSQARSTDIIDSSVASVSSLMAELERVFNDNDKRLKMKQILLDLENNNAEAHKIRNQKSALYLAALNQLNIGDSAKLKALIDLITVPDEQDKTKRRLTSDTNNPAYKVYAEQLFPKAQKMRPDLNLKLENVEGVLRALSESIGNNLIDVRKKIMASNNLFKRSESSFKDILLLTLNESPTSEQEAFLNSLGLSSIKKGISIDGVSSAPFSVENPSPFSIDNPIYGFLNRTAARQLFDAGGEGMQPAMQRVLSTATYKGELREFITSNFTKTKVKDASGKEIVVKDGELDRAKALLLEDARRVSKEISELFRRNTVTDPKTGKITINENIKNSPDYGKLQEEFILIALKIGLIDSSNTLFSQIVSLSQQSNAFTQFGGAKFEFNPQSLLNEDQATQYKEAEELIKGLTQTETEFQEATTGKLGEQFENLFPDLFTKIRRSMPYDPIAASNQGHQFDYEITLVGTFFARKTLELYQNDVHPDSKTANGENGETGEDPSKNVLDPVNLYNIAFTSFGERFKVQKDMYGKQTQIANTIATNAINKISYSSSTAAA